MINVAVPILQIFPFQFQTVEVFAANTSPLLSIMTTWKILVAQQADNSISLVIVSRNTIIIKPVCRTTATCFHSKQ